MVYHMHHNIKSTPHAIIILLFFKIGGRLLSCPHVCGHIREYYGQFCVTAKRQNGYQGHSICYASVR